MKLKLLTAMLLLLAVSWSSHGQEVAIKSNLLYDATLTLNLGVEKKFAP